jgi:hypothetical protein
MTPPRERDEVAPSHAKLPVEDEAYQRAALCATANLASDVADGSILLKNDFEEGL